MEDTDEACQQFETAVRERSALKNHVKDFHERMLKDSMVIEGLKGENIELRRKTNPKREKRLAMITARAKKDEGMDDILKMVEQMKNQG